MFNILFNFVESIMINKKQFLSFIIIILSLFMYLYKHRVLIDLNDCPYCFGTNFCDRLEKLSFVNLSLLEKIHNYINVKNVFYAFMNDEKIILKKLAHNEELKKIDKIIINENITELRQIFHSKVVKLVRQSELEVKNFVICDENGVDLFLKAVIDFNNDLKEDRLLTIWTLLHVNVEPLILHMLNNHLSTWPIPKYYGACGRIIAESYNGETFTNLIFKLEWRNRAYLALQILRAAVKFTEGDQNFRFYLTDISPDNLAVDSYLNITFIDLENIILVSKFNKVFETHVSEDMDGEESDFSYSESQICHSAISDHNIYVVCKLILSQNAPYPMIKGGLLYNPPLSQNSIIKKINLCASSTKNINRFELSENIINELIKIIDD